MPVVPDENILESAGIRFHPDSMAVRYADSVTKAAGEQNNKYGLQQMANRSS